MNNSTNARMNHSTEDAPARRGARPLLLLLMMTIGWTALSAARAAAQDAPDEPEEEFVMPPVELERVDLRAGLYGAYAYHMHATTASVFSSGLDCGAFGDGDGRGFALGAFIEVPLLLELLDLYGGVGYTARGGALGEVVVGGLPILDPNTDEYTTLRRRHAYTTSLSYLRTEFGVRVTLPWFPLYLRATAAMDFPQGTDYHQTEQILSPSGVLYPETNTTTRTVGEGALSAPEALMSAAGAIGYQIPLGVRLSIAPEISYYHPFNDVVLDRDWRIRSIQAGAALRWSFGPTRVMMDPPEAPLYEPETPPLPEAPRPPVVALNVKSPKELSIVKTIVTETFPILPYIFFDSADTMIPTRYRVLAPEETMTFDEEAVSWNSLEAYHDLLNILGQRMTADKSITITVNGTTDGREVETPEEMERVARTRAESIRGYLTETWDIDAKRIAVTTSPRPLYPSNDDYVEGYEENRRVEIRSSSVDALRPIIHRRFNEYSYTPDQLSLEMSTSGARVTSWDLTVSAGDVEIFSSAGEGPPPSSFGVGMSQERADRIASAIEGSGALTTTLTARARDVDPVSGSREVPTTVALNPFEVSRLSLIVFDFDKSEITPSNRAMVTAFVSDALNDGSTLTIVGSTDRLGELDHNRELSQARAEAVRGIIAAEKPEAEITAVEGVGPKMRYDNALPEGRYYCRTVTVEVKTPIGGM